MLEFFAKFFILLVSGFGFWLLISEGAEKSPYGEKAYLGG